MYKKTHTNLLFIVALLFSLNVSAGSFKAEILWAQETIDFGKIEKDKSVEVVFNFKNSGMTPLIISSVKPSCGCTVADYPKQPIAPGENGKIKVTYDSKTTGFFSKTIVVNLNTEDGITNLFIKGEVVLPGQTK